MPHTHPSLPERAGARTLSVAAHPTGGGGDGGGDVLIGVSFMASLNEANRSTEV